MKRKASKKNLINDDNHNSKSIGDEEDWYKNYHFKVGISNNWVEIFFSIFTTVYLIMVLMMYASEWDNWTILKYLGWSLALMVLPFYRVRRVFDSSKTPRNKFLDSVIIRSTPIRVALSSLAFLVPTLFLENYIGGENPLVLYFSISLLIRLVDARSLYDCFALCLVYSVNLDDLSSLYRKIWFATTRVLLWICLMLGLLCAAILRRSTYRIWEHIRLLIILRKKTKQERLFSNFIASAHFSPDLVEAATKRRDVSTENSKRLEKSPYGDVDPVHETGIIHSNPIAEAASEAGILFSFREKKKPLLSLEKIKSLDGLERKLATVVAFKLVLSDDRECCLNGQTGHIMHDLLDHLAFRHRISCVRKFGDTWVGCIGHHRSWDNNRKDGYHAIVMGCEAMILAKRMQLQLCCAIESGKIDAGFVGSSNYDVFGPEIRWVLNMVEAKKHGHVLVGNSARSLNTRQKAGDPDPINTVHFGRIIIDSIWRIKQDCEKVPYVYQTSDIVPNEDALIEEFFDEDDIKKSILSGGQDAGQLHSGMTWQAVQKILDGSDRPNTTGRAIDRQTWDEEIGCEMQMTVEERFGISLNDHVLQGLSEEDLEDLHLEIEASVRSLMIKHFFGNYFRLLTLLSPCKYRYGVYDQVVPASSLNLPDESEEFLSPLECLLSSFPYARSWFAQDDKRKQKKFEDTDVSLREKIKKEAVSHLQLATGSNKSVAISAARDSRRLSANQRSGSTSRLSGLSAPPGLSKRNPGSVHACLYNSEADDLQHFYTDTRPDLDEIINPSPSLNRTIRIGEHSMTHDYSLHSNIIKSVRIKPDSLRCKNAPLSPGLHKGYTSLKGCFVPVDIDGIDGGKSDQPARGLQKYSSDSRCLDNCPLRFCYGIIALYAVMLCIVNEELHLNTDVAKPSYIFGFLSLNFLILYISERKYDNVVCVILLIFRCLLTISIMPYLANGTDDAAICSGIQYLQGSALLVFGLWFPIALRQSFLLNCVELMVHTMGILLLRGAGHHTNCRPRIGASKILPVVAILLILFWAIEYLCIVSYVIENILAPEAQALYQREYVHAREILHACSPNTQPDKSKHLYCPRRYRCCSILAVHVKAADVLPGLVDSLSVASFMKEIMLLIEGCVKECGLLKVTNFSGIFVAACPDLVDDNSPVNYITRTVMCLRKIQAKLDAFSRRNSVNVSVGAGMSSGPVTMGLLGNTRFCFDVCGATRDLAIFMACHQNDGIFASEIFGPYIRDGQLSDDLVMREVQVTSGHKSMKWLQLDGAFNKGMQLDDFEYMCMLGRGGFGSVHLLWENATEKEYAIKAIPRKKGSAIPKMIQREFIILQQIQHANVVSFKCCIINKSMIYLVMSYVRGGNLKQIVERNKPDLKHLTLWFAELVLALNYIHSLGIIHRDVKPANCMIDASGHLKLADFGLSKIVSPIPSSGFDPTGPVDEEDYRNASATVAINLIKSILPLKSNMSDGEYVLPERSVQIFLIDFNIMSSSAKRLREMYFKVSTVSSAAGAKETMKQSNFKAQIILVDLDSVNISDPTSTMTSGLALLQQLSISSKNVPIVALSSIDDRELRRKIIDAGAREVLTLPIHKAARDTLLKYGRLYHHLNKPLRSKSFHVSPPVKLSKKVEDPNDTFRVPGVPTHIRSLDNVAVCTSENDNEVEGGVALSALPSSLAGNTSFYSHGMYGTERTDTPNTANEHKTQMWSAQTARHVVSDGQQKHSAVGTIHFMAPEVIFDHKYGRSVDWWACGVTFYECTVRQHLFNGADKEIIMQHILSGPIDLDPLSQYSTLLQRLVAGLLVRNPVLRLGTDGAHTIMRQEFFKGIDWNTISESNPNYKPAQHVNQRHSVEDKMLFYGEVHGNKTERSRTEIGPEDYRRSASVKEGRGAPSSTGRSKKRYGKNLNMRQRKEEFQKLTDQRKSWVSGNHLLSGLEGSKKTGPYSGVGASKQASARPLGMGNPNATARSGMMNASLDWSITMLPEGDSSNSEESKGEYDEEERKESDSKSPNQEEADVQEVQQKQEQEIQHEHLEEQDKQQQEVEVVVAKMHQERGKQEKEEREEMKEQDVSQLQEQEQEHEHEQEQEQDHDGTVHVVGTNSQSICSSADVNASHCDDDDAAAECETSTCKS